MHIDIPLPGNLSTDPHYDIDPSTQLVSMYFDRAPAIATAMAIVPGLLYRLLAHTSESHGIKGALSYHMSVV
jgi:hypothetical protein